MDCAPREICMVCQCWSLSALFRSLSFLTEALNMTTGIFFVHHSPWSKTGFLTCIQMVSKSLVQELHHHHHHHHCHFHCNTTYAGNMSSSIFCEPKTVDTLQESAHFVWKTKRIVNEGGFVSIVALLIHDDVISDTTNSNTVRTL